MRILREIGDWVIGARAESVTVSPDRQTVYSFDLEGRPLSWFENECVYKRSLASEVHGREQFHGVRRRWRLTPAEAGTMFERMLGRLAEAPVGRLDPDMRQLVEPVLRWTPESLLAEKERFQTAYRPISILPPDQYLSIVLQATFGCSWNQCTFCDFYQDRPFSVRPPAEFRDHILAVKALVGRGAALRRHIFLADGNALILSNERLRPIVDAASVAFPGRRINGFVDVYSGERKEVEQWRELRGWGLDRVHVGIETGNDPLLRWMNKPGGADEASEFVTILKTAGLRVSVIFMCGVGGDRFAEMHVRDTVRLLERLPLGAGDIVYLSPFVEHPESAYGRKAREDGVRALEDGEGDRQYAALRDAARGLHPAAKVTRYDIREFVY